MSSFKNFNADVVVAQAAFAEYQAEKLLLERKDRLITRDNNGFRTDEGTSLGEHDLFVAQAAYVLLDSEAIGSYEVKVMGFTKTVHWVTQRERLNVAFLLWKANYIQA